jgi:hypothetical protein
MVPSPIAADDTRTKNRRVSSRVTMFALRLWTSGRTTSLHIVEWLLASFVLPVFLIAYPLFQGVSFIGTGRSGEYLVLSFAVTSTLLVGDLIYLYKHRSNRDVLTHTIMALLLAFSIILLFASRFRDGSLQEMSTNSVWASMFLTTVTVVLGLFRPVKPLSRSRPPRARG